MNKREIGWEKEQVACEYLMEKGYEIQTTNYYCRQGEIDIVAKQGEYYVFVEVKYRKNNQCGGSLYAVSPKKMQRVRKSAEIYLYRERIGQQVPIRFDVIAIEGDAIEHIENAF